jgi:outer membrane lipoprotein-sorting protein
MYRRGIGSPGGGISEVAGKSDGEEAYFRSLITESNSTRLRARAFLACGFLKSTLWPLSHSQPCQQIEGFTRIIAAAYRIVDLRVGGLWSGCERYHICMRFGGVCVRSGGPVFLLIGLVAAPTGLAADAHKYLQKAAAAYRHLKSLQVDASTERVQDVDGVRSRTFVRIAVYASSPNNIRIDTKGADNSARSVLLSDGTTVTEFHAWNNEYVSSAGTGLDIRFSPERGVGLGEMTYDTIDERVSKAVLRGRQTLELGDDRVSCAVVDVEYGRSTAKFSFWIMEKKNLVLQRAVTYLDGSVINTVVSKVRALTANEEIPTTVFQFSPPNGARQVSVSSWSREK